MSPTDAVTEPGHEVIMPAVVTVSPDGARAAVAEAAHGTPRDGLRRTVSWADAQPDKDKSVGLVAVREFEPRCARAAGAHARRSCAEPRPCPPSEAGDTEDGYANSRKGCCTVQ